MLPHPNGCNEARQHQNATTYTPATQVTTPFQSSHWKLVSGATAGYISDGYTLGVVGIALAAAQPQLNLTAPWLGAIGSSSLAGLFLGALISGWAADRYGRRFGSAAGFLVVDWLPRRQFVIGSFAVTTIALLLSNTTTGVVVLSFAVFSCVLSAAQAQIYVYLPELFPTSLRASGLGIAVAVSRLGAAAGTFLLPLCVAHYGVSVALYVCTATLILGGTVAFRWAPETRLIQLRNQ